MIVFYITGASSGIGKALAEQALLIEESLVYGFSRTQSIEHPNYIHTSIDLSCVEDLTKLNFHKHSDAFKVVLINNAGTIGDIKPIGSQTNNTIISVFNLNTICPIILANKFIQTYNDIDASQIIVNISSGAARHPIESWAPYCASKAAIDMFSQVLQAEKGYGLKEKVRVFSIAPGIVDTNMQTLVRSTNSKDFPHLDKFIGYKEKGQLSSTESVARKILEIVEKPEGHQNVLLDIRQL
ncbi:MAG: SDR family NAD(P)-dependent oxidoreductase [Tenuifilaceae bacterium]